MALVIKTQQPVINVEYDYIYDQTEEHIEIMSEGELIKLPKNKVLFMPQNRISMPLELFNELFPNG